MATFGNTNEDVNNGSTGLTPEFLMVCKYTLTENGYISKLSIYTKIDVGLSFNMKGVIYSDNSGAPNALQGSASNVTNVNSTTLAWYDLNFSSVISLTAGVYWLGVVGQSDWGGNQFAVGTTNQYAYVINSDYYTSVPSTFPEPHTWDGPRAIDIYATYTTTISGRTNSSSRNLSSNRNVVSGRGLASSRVNV